MTGYRYATGAALVALLTSPALSVQAIPNAAPAPQPVPSNGVSEIIVTAQKRSQSLQQVPISVSVASAQTIERSAIKTAAQLPNLSPALTFTSGAAPNYITFNIRGVGSYIYGIGVQPAVSVVVDGVPLARTAEFAGELGDIDRVEVLSGPQGTLFGRNSTGGAVNIVRAVPKPDFSGYVAGELIAGRLGDTERLIKGMVNAPINDNMRLRVFAYDRANDDYITNLHPTAPDVGKHHVYGVQGKLAVDLAHNVDLLLSGDYAHDYARTGDPEILIPLQAYQQPRVPDITAKEIALQQGAIGKRFTVDDWAPFYGRTVTGGGTADLTWHLSDKVSIKSLTSYRQASVKAFTSYYPGAASVYDPQAFDLLGSTTTSLNDDAPYSRATRWHYLTQELRIAAQTRSIDAVAGLFYTNFHESIDGDQPRFVSAQAAGRVPDPTSTFDYYFSNTYLEAADRNRVFAGFADVTWHPFRGVSLFAGGRVSRETLDFDYLRLAYSNLHVQYGVNFNQATQSPTVAPSSLAFAGRHGETDWAGRAGAAYQLFPHANVYGTYSRGYIGAGVDLGNGSVGTAADPEKAVLKPSVTQNYEIGFKSELFDRHLRLNLALFKMTTTDVQLSSLVPGTTTALIQNAGDIRAKGLELNAEAQLGPAFNLTAGIAYLHANFANLEQPCYPGQTVVTGCFANPAGGTIQDVSGKPALNAPRWKLNLAPTYTIRLPNAPFDIYLRGDYEWRSKVYFQLDHDPFASQGAYGIVNVAVGFTSKSGDSELRFFVNNLTDKYYCLNMVNGPLARQSCQTSPIDAQRRIGIAAKFGF